MGERLGDEVELDAIDRARDAHVGALNAGDAAAWVGLFAEDGVQMPPHASANVGRESIGRWSRGLLGHFRVRFRLTVDEVRVLGDWAFERGGYAIDLSPAAGGAPMHEDGKYLTLYRKGAAGGWEIARDIWNSDAPPPAS